MMDIVERTRWACPECGATPPADEWRSTTVYCEDCGDHAAIECPNCEKVFDMVFRDEEFPGFWDHYRVNGQ